MFESESKKKTEQLKEIELKMKGITDSYKTKEDNFQTKLAATEKKLLRHELFEFEAQEKRAFVEEQLERERNEWKDSKQELHKVIRSLYFQAHMLKNQARDGWVS